MEIVLFSSNFSHDHTEIEGKDILGGWLHGGMQKPTNFTMNLAKALGAEGDGEKDYFPHLLLRKEHWGGLVFNAKNSAVYQVDHEGFITFQKLKSGIPKEQIESTIKNNNLISFQTFFSFIEKHSIF